MNQLKTFYQKTFYFWIILKVLLGIGAFIILNDQIKGFSKANFIGLIYSLLMILDVIFVVTNTSAKGIRRFTGFFSLFFAIIITVLLLTIGDDLNLGVPMGILVVICLILTGLFDLLQIHKNVD